MGETGNAVQLTKSAVREVRAGLLALAPALEPLLEELAPKGEQCFGVRLKEHERGELLVVQGRWSCVRVEGRWLPSLRFLQRHPGLLPRFQVDRGAVAHVLNGANVMGPGLVSAGGAMAEAPANAFVLLFAEGKAHPLALGLTARSSAEIRGGPAGLAVRTVLVMGDELWEEAFTGARKA